MGCLFDDVPDPDRKRRRLARRLAMGVIAISVIADLSPYYFEYDPVIDEKWGASLPRPFHGDDRIVLPDWHVTRPGQAPAPLSPSQPCSTSTEPFGPRPNPNITSGFKRSDCDANVLLKEGTDLFARGSHAAALAKFHDSFQCKPNTNTANLAFLAACRARNAALATLYYDRISNQSLINACRQSRTRFD